MLKLIVPSMGSSTHSASVSAGRKTFLLAEEGDPGVCLGQHFPDDPLDLDVDGRRVIAIALGDHRPVVGAATTDELRAEVDRPLGRQQHRR